MMCGLRRIIFLFAGFFCGITFCMAEEKTIVPRDVHTTDDSSTSDGKALLVTKPNYKAGDVFFTATIPVQQAGRYRIVWRIAANGSAAEDVVLRAKTTCQKQNFASGTLEIKGSDLPASGGYADFSYVAEIPDGSVFTTTGVWGGNGELRLDHIQITQEERYTDQILAEKNGPVPLPLGRIFPPLRTPRILIVKGLWWQYFALEEALARIKGATFASAYQLRNNTGTELRGFDQDGEFLQNFNLVILANVDAHALGVIRRIQLAEYVRGGGSLLICGGPFAFSGPMANTSGTALADLLPCDVRNTGSDRIRLDGATALAPAKAGTVIFDENLSWNLLPRVFYRHEVTPRKGALVAATLDDKPAVLAWDVGQGRVAAFAFSAEGDPAPEALAFWEWGDLPCAVAGVCRWLIQRQKDLPDGIPAGVQTALEKLYDDTHDMKATQQIALIHSLAAYCRNTKITHELLSAVEAADFVPDDPIVYTVWLAVRPYVNASFEVDVFRLVGSQHAGKSALGLLLLGAVRTPKSEAKLLQVLSGEANAQTEYEPESLLDTGQNDLSARVLLLIAAVMGLGDTGNAAHIPTLRKITQQYSNQREILQSTDANLLKSDELYQQSLASRMRLGDATAVAPFLNILDKNMDAVDQCFNLFDDMIAYARGNDTAFQNAVKRCRFLLPILTRRRELCLALTRDLPPSSYAILGEEVAKWNDPMRTSFVFNALVGASSVPADSQALRGLLPVFRSCRLTSLRLLAWRWLQSTGSPELRKELTTAVIELAGSATPEDVLFALSLLSELEPAERTRVLQAARANTDARIQRQIRLLVLPAK